MSYPLAFPTNIFPENVRVTRRTAAKVSESPSNYSTQVYQEPGERWEIEVTMQRMNRDDAAAFSAFIFGLKGRVGTFAFDLTPHCPGIDPAPGTVNFRLAESNPGWDSRLARDFGFSFRAYQDL